MQKSTQFLTKFWLNALVKIAKPATPKRPRAAEPADKKPRAAKLVNKRPKVVTLSELESDCFLDLQTRHLHFNECRVIILQPQMNNDNKQEKLDIELNCIKNEWERMWDWKKLRNNHESE